MSEHSLSVTLKAGTGYDSPWIVVYGDTLDEVEFKLKNTAGLIAATVEAANLLKAANNAAPLTAPEPAPAQQQAPQGWGQQQPAQQEPSWAAQSQQQRPPQGGSHPNAQLHPEGKACEQCGKTLEMKKTQSGKGKWQCPDWRWNNGNPNGHGMEWVN